MKKPDNTSKLALFLSICGVICAAQIAGACQGSQGSQPVRTTVEAGVRLDGKSCSEVSAPPPNLPPDRSIVDCISGEISVRIELPRAQWMAIKAATEPAPFEAGPGK
jgi:hypothetical protein